MSWRAEDPEGVLAPLVGRYLALREGGIENELNGCIEELDRFYWGFVERKVAEKVARDPTRLHFTEDERLVIDTGLLDTALVAGGGDELPAELRSEFRSSQEDGIFYLSEWLADRLANYQAISVIDGEQSGDEAADGSAAALKRERSAIYERVGHLFRNVPGLTPAAMLLLVRGRLDDQVERMVAERSMRSGQADEVDKAVRRLEALFARVIESASSRARTDAESADLERLRDLRMEIFRAAAGVGQESASGRPGGTGSPRPGGAVESAGEFLRSEISLIRNLLKIGSLGGDIARVHSVLLQNVPRPTATEVARVREHIGACDPRVELNQNILIAPFTGNGFFEWDRNTLVVGLIPARSVEEDVVSAVASYRIMADNLYFDGELRRKYEAAFPNERFQRRFMKDYRSWVLRVGTGRKDGVEPKAFDFFREHIGPRVTGVPLPREIERLSAAQKAELVRRCQDSIRKGGSAPSVRRTLGLLLWAKGSPNEAVRELERARVEMPDDGLTLYSLGVLYRRQRMTASARKFLTECTRRAKDTIWSVYAYEERRAIQ